MRTSSCCVLLALAATARAQATYVVTGGGAALQNAINAAAPGDILDVWPGTYSPISTGKGVRVMLRGTATIAIPMPTSPPSFAVTLSGLPAGQTFVLHGGEVQTFQAQNCAGGIIWHASQQTNQLLGNMMLAAFVNCSGPVIAEDLRTTTPGWTTSGQLEVTDCAQVSFTNCPSLPSTIVTRSNVSFMDSGAALPFGWAPGLRLVSGSVLVAGGQFRHGANTFGSPGPGILVEQGHLTLTRGALVSSTVPMAPAIDTLGGTVRLDPSVVLIGTVPVAGPAMVTNAFVPSIAASHASGSSTCQFQLAAEPNSLVFTLVNLPLTPFPSPWGEIWLPTYSPILNVAQLGAGGTHSFAWSVAVVVPPLLPLVVQTASLSPSNTIAVGAPVRFLWD